MPAKGMFQKMVCISEIGKDGRLEEPVLNAVKEWKDGWQEFVPHSSILLSFQSVKSFSRKFETCPIRQVTFLELFEEPIGKLLIESEHIKLRKTG